MKRPSFQFYPADWRGNTKLRRCTEAARGAWVDIMCVLHDSDEYGVLRWPLEDILRAAGVSEKSGKELVSKLVLKGSDGDMEDFIYTPMHAGKAGDPVVLVAANHGPCWFSSRMVTDEYLRQVRGFGVGFGTPKATPKATPKGGIGAMLGATPKGGMNCRATSSSSSSSSSIHKDHKASSKGFTPHQTELTERMHKCLDGQWENDRQKWMGRIARQIGKTERVIAEVESALKESRIKTTPAQYAEEIWGEFQ